MDVVTFGPTYVNAFLFGQMLMSQMYKSVPSSHTLPNYYLVPLGYGRRWLSEGNVFVVCGGFAFICVGSEASMERMRGLGVRTGTAGSGEMNSSTSSGRRNKLTWSIQGTFVVFLETQGNSHRCLLLWI